MPEKNLSLIPSNAQNIQLSQQAKLSLSEMEKLSIHFKASALFGVTAQSQAQCIIKMLAGNELGIGPWTSVKEIFITEKGKLGMSSFLMAAMIKRSPKYKTKILEASEVQCAIEFLEYDQNLKEYESLGLATFTREQAERAKLLTKETYKSYLEDMLYNRALARGARRYCADLFCGSVYLIEELNEIDSQIKETKTVNPNVKPDVSGSDQEFLLKKQEFISSINKMNSVLGELGQIFTVDRYEDFYLADIKSIADEKSAQLRLTLLEKLKYLVENDSHLPSLTTVELYKLYQSKQSE